MRNRWRQWLEGKFAASIPAMFSALLLFVACPWLTTAHSEIDATALRAWVGIYPYDKIRGRSFLDDSEILTRVISALGPGAISQIKGMTTVGPILQRGDWIIAYGCHPQACSDAKWWIAINLFSFEIRACLASLGSPTIRLGASGRPYSDVRRVSGGGACPEPEKAIPVFDKLLAKAPASERDGQSQTALRPQNNSQSRNWIRIPMVKDGGTFGVPVEINSALTLKFVLDSGATDVSIPADVFLTLIRTGTIKDSDVFGEQTYVLADGSKSKSVTFTIRSLKVGDTTISNVKGNVAASQGILLLGQSFLGRFKSWSVDNVRRELVLEQQ